MVYLSYKTDDFDKNVKNINIWPLDFMRSMNVFC